MKELNFEQTTKTLLSEFVLEDVYVYVNLTNGLKCSSTGNNYLAVTAPMKNQNLFSGNVFGDDNLYKFVENIRDTVDTFKIKHLELPVKKMKCVYTAASPMNKNKTDEDNLSAEDQKMFVNFIVTSIVIDQEKLAKGMKYIAPFEHSSSSENEGLLSMYSPSSSDSSQVYEVNIREDNSQSDVTPFSL